MKIQLDTVAKTIKVEGNINMGELIANLDKILPKIWKEYELQSQTTIVNWSSPIYIEKHWPYYPSPIWVSNTSQKGVYCVQSSSTMENGNKNMQLNSGTYNIEC